MIKLPAPSKSAARMERKRREKSRSRGFVLVTLALALIPILGMGAIILDLGFAYLLNLEMQNAADMAALAGAKRFAAGNANLNDIYEAASITSEENAIRLNQTAVSHNEGGGNSRQLPHGVVINRQDVQVGIYNYNNRSFSENNINAPETNSVRVTVSMAPGANTPFTWRLANVLGFKGQNLWSRDAVAIKSRRHIVFALDVSSSMDDLSYPHFSNNVLANCPTAWFRYNYQIDYRDYLNRNFRMGPYRNYNDTHCMGGRPEPAYSVWERVDEFLVKNPIFRNSYRLGFITFGSNATIEEDLSRDNNKDRVRKIIADTLKYWDDYRMKEDPKAFVPNGPYTFPGGRNPGGYLQANTGFTNIGEAIQNARNMIDNARAGMTVPTDDFIILLSDGVPNCGSAYYGYGYNPDLLTNPCGNDAMHRLAGTQYASMQAGTAYYSYNINVYTIYFGEAGSCGNSEGYYFLNRLATEGKGETFCAENAEKLKNLFEQFARRPLILLAR